jgi:hypothetical protein
MGGCVSGIHAYSPFDRDQLDFILKTADGQTLNASDNLEGSLAISPTIVCYSYTQL